jgi:chitodextrinase
MNFENIKRLVYVSALVGLLAACVAGCSGIEANDSKLSAPVSLSATAASDTRVDLAWMPGPHNSNVSYQIFRDGNSTVLAESAGNTYADTSVVADTTYSYQVRAIDAAKHVSPLSSVATVRTKRRVDTTPPTAPAELSATAATGARVDLAWTASTDNAGVVKYRVFRDASTVPLAESVGTVYSDLSVTADTTYSYQVVALDAANNVSQPSNTATVTTPAHGTRECPPFPAFPDVNCTGVPAGYPLTTVNGDLSTTFDGQLIDGMFITGDLTVNHDDVKVTNTRVKGRVNYRDHRRLTLEDVDVGADSCPPVSSGSGLRLITGDASYTLVRAHLHNNDDDLLITGGGDPVLIQDSLLDKSCFYPGDHLDAVQFYDPGGVGAVTIAHSRIDVRPVNSTDHGNSAVFWADTPGPGSKLTIYDSLLAGGGFSLAAYDSGLGSGVIIDVHDTWFVRDSYGASPCNLGDNNPANHSPTIPFNGSEGIKWANNAYDDGVVLPSCQ